jgi:hypothetical protein
MNKKLFGFMAGGLVLVVGAQAHALTVSGTGDVIVQNSTSSSSTADASATLQVGSVGLQAQVQAGTVNTSSDDTVVSLQGDSIGMIQTSDDLTAYNNLVLKARPAVTSVNVNSDNSIDIGYAQPAKFLGLFSTSLSGDVHVDASGNTAVHLPWYAFLYSKDTTNVQASVASAVQKSGAQFNAQADASTSAQDHARVINAATAAIQAQALASATANGSTSTY